jgi:4-methyl-5(b-hydroxyethyl)-thiazole monophosphate biosynthesis
MKRVLVILPNAFEVFEAAALIDVLGWANHYGDTPIETVTAGTIAEIECTFSVLTVRPNALLADIDAVEFDAVAIPGGFESHGFFTDAYSETVLQTLRDFEKSGKPVASICVGALALAKSGILSGKRATTYHLMGGERRKQLAELGANVVDAAIVADDNKITSASPATAIDVALMLVEKLTSPENAERIRHLMGFAVPDSGITPVD